MAFEVFSAKPSVERAIFLRKQMNEKLFKNLTAAIGVAHAVLPGQADNAAKLLDDFDVNRRISPDIFALYRQLSMAVRGQNIAGAAVALSRLSMSYLDGRLYADQRDITTLQWDTADVETIEYLDGPQGPRGPAGDIPEMLPYNSKRLDELVAHVHTATRWLQTADPDMFDEHDHLVASVRLIESRNFGSISTPRSFGLMHIRQPGRESEIANPALFYFDQIIHETSHIALNAVMTLDPLVLNDPQARYPSPLRKDLRPMEGLYHAVFVLSRIVRGLDSLARSHPHESVLEARTLTLQNFNAGYRTVTEHGELTDAGKRIMDSCEEMIQDLLVDAP